MFDPGIESNGKDGPLGSPKRQTISDKLHPENKNNKKFLVSIPLPPGFEKHNDHFQVPILNFVDGSVFFVTFKF